MRQAISSFFFIGIDERNLIAEWVEKAERKTHSQKSFIDRVKLALDTIDYDFMIATLEPCVSEDGNIFYHEGWKSIVSISYLDWQEKASKFYFDDKWYSKLASLYEGDLFKAYQMATGYLSENAVVDELHHRNCMKEIFELGEGFAVVRGKYSGAGRCFLGVFDYFSKDIATLASYGFGVISLKPK